MKFNPKFSSFRSRIAVLALVLWINAFLVLSGHRPAAFGMVVLAVAGALAAIIPESRGKQKTRAEKYTLTEGQP